MARQAAAAAQDDPELLELEAKYLHKTTRARAKARGAHLLIALSFMRFPGAWSKRVGCGVCFA